MTTNLPNLFFKVKPSTEKIISKQFQDGENITPRQAANTKRSMLDGRGVEGHRRRSRASGASIDDRSRSGKPQNPSEKERRQFKINTDRPLSRMIDPVLRRYMLQDGNLPENLVLILHESVQTFSRQLRDPRQALLAAEDVDYIRSLLLCLPLLTDLIVREAIESVLILARKNKPALLSDYFRSMTQILHEKSALAGVDDKYLAPGKTIPKFLLELDKTKLQTVKFMRDILLTGQLKDLKHLRIYDEIATALTYTKDSVVIGAIAELAHTANTADKKAVPLEPMLGLIARAEADSQAYIKAKMLPSGHENKIQRRNRAAKPTNTSKSSSQGQAAPSDLTGEVLIGAIENFLTDYGKGSALDKMENFEMLSMESSQSGLLSFVAAPMQYTCVQMTTSSFGLGIKNYFPTPSALRAFLATTFLIDRRFKLMDSLLGVMPPQTTSYSDSLMLLLLQSRVTELKPELLEWIISKVRSSHIVEYVPERAKNLLVYVLSLMPPISKRSVVSRLLSCALSGERYRNSGQLVLYDETRKTERQPVSEADLRDIDQVPIDIAFGIAANWNFFSNLGRSADHHTQTESSNNQEASMSDSEHDFQPGAFFSKKNQDSQPEIPFTVSGVDKECQDLIEHLTPFRKYCRLQCINRLLSESVTLIEKGRGTIGGPQKTLRPTVGRQESLKSDKSTEKEKGGFRSPKIHTILEENPFKAGAPNKLSSQGSKILGQEMLGVRRAKLLEFSRTQVDSSGARDYFYYSKSSTSFGVTPVLLMRSMEVVSQTVRAALTERQEDAWNSILRPKEDPNEPGINSTMAGERWILGDRESLKNIVRIYLTRNLENPILTQESASTGVSASSAEVQAGELFNKIIQKAMELEETRFSQYQVDVTTKSLPLQLKNKERPHEESSIPSPTLGPMTRLDNQSSHLNEDMNMQQEDLEPADFKMIGSESDFDPPSPTSSNPFQKVLKTGQAITFVRELKDARDARIVSAEKHINTLQTHDQTSDGYSKFHIIPSKCREETVREVAQFATDLLKEVSLIIAAHVVNTNVSASVRLNKETTKFGHMLQTPAREPSMQPSGIVKAFQSVKYSNCLSMYERELFHSVLLLSEYLNHQSLLHDAMVLELVLSWASRAPLADHLLTMTLTFVKRFLACNPVEFCVGVLMRSLSLDQVEAVGNSIFMNNLLMRAKRLKLPHNSPKVREHCTVHDMWWFGVHLFTDLFEWSKIALIHSVEESLKAPPYKSQVTRREVEESERTSRDKSRVSDRAKSTDHVLPSIRNKSASKSSQIKSLDPTFLRVLMKRFSHSISMVNGEIIENFEATSGIPELDDPSSVQFSKRSRTSSFHKRQTFGK